MTTDPHFGVPLPDRVSRMERDPRGYPILASIRKSNGDYDFRGIHASTVLSLIREQRCGVCGEPLTYWKAFIGGPQAIANRVFSDPAMHRECAEYAVAVCPYLAYARTPRQVSEATPDLIDALDATAMPGHIDAKPDRVGVGIARGYRLIVPHLLIRADTFVKVIWSEPKGTPSTPAPDRPEA